KQVLSIHGAEPCAGNQFYILINGAGPYCHPSGSFPDAWRFDSGGCNAGQFNPTASVGVSKASCPKSEGANALPLYQYAFDPSSNVAALQVGDEYDNNSISPSGTYTLWIFNFDHSYSVAGP